MEKITMSEYEYCTFDGVLDSILEFFWRLTWPRVYGRT
jgi:hypothetical protein